jgi:hypothetical protein
MKFTLAKRAETTKRKVNKEETWPKLQQVSSARGAARLQHRGSPKSF